MAAITDSTIQLPGLGGGGNPFMDFLQSNGGSSIISGLLGGLGSMGQARANERMNQQQLDLQKLGLGLNAQQGNQQDMFNRDALLAQQAPTGWAQNYEQQTLLKNIMLQKLLAGSQLQPTNPAVAERLNAATGGGFKPTIPDEWQQHNPFGVDMSANSIAQRQGVLDLLSGGRGPGLDITQFGGNAGQQQQMNDYRNFTNQQYNNQQDNLLRAVGLKADGTQLGGAPTQRQGGSLLGSVTGGAMTGAKLGSFVPGIGTAIGAAGGALVGALGNAFGQGPSKADQLRQLGGTPQPIQRMPGQTPHQAMQQNYQLNQSLLDQLQGRQLQPVNGPQQPSFKNPYLGY